MRPTGEIEKSFESFIDERGYQIAPITIDIMDWMFRVVYANARNQNDEPLMKRVSEEYLKFAEKKFELCERVTNEVLGHQLRQILLLHANELNADNFDALIKVIEARGYKFISLEQALKDPVYQFPDKYLPTSDWLSLWSFTMGKKFESPQPPDFIRKIYDETQSLPAPVELTAEQDHQRLMDLLHITSLRPGANPNNPQEPNAWNYDEAKAIPYPSLPYALLLKNGKRVTSAKMWWDQRRPEIVEDFDREIYGRVPKYTPKVNWETTSTTNEKNGDVPIVLKKLVVHVHNSYPPIPFNIHFTFTTPPNATAPMPLTLKFD